jgi:glycosyltransferase involved in cell wall biosynthesis
MRIGVLMAVDSPWSKETVLRFCDLGHDVHIIDIARSSRDRGYLDDQLALRKSAVTALGQRAQIHEIVPPVNFALRYFLTGPALKSLCVKCGIDLILTLYGGGFATMAWVSGFRPYVIYTVGSDVLFARGLKKVIHRFTHRRADRIFANGVYLCARTKELTGREDVESLYLGVNTERFVAQKEKRRGIVILCTRGFSAIYNNEYLLEALALLPDESPYAEVVFSSTGPELNQAKSLADRILSPAGRKKVHFLGGVSADGLVDQLQRASIFVSLSRSDGTSISFLEALACELFPVMSDIPQNREWISPELSNGILVPLERPKALADALQRAMSDEGLRESAGSINRDLLRRRADGKTNVGILAAKLEEIVEKRRSKFA